ncbi:hypothetical protein, partial [Escherichia coli]|uniref:hypothetical protein n=1 Tax=Escherichia coli TaxID=562 RepID=UPI0019531FCB
MSHQLIEPLTGAGDELCRSRHFDVSPFDVTAADSDHHPTTDHAGQNRLGDRTYVGITVFTMSEKQ